MPLLLLRPPANSLTKGLVSHIKDERDSINYEKAIEQWESYKNIFVQQGWQIGQIDKEDSLPDSVFIEDGIVSVNNLQKDSKSKSGLLILTSPGNEAREGEIEGIQKWVKTSLSDYGLTEIVKPGKLDGGDILKVPALQKIYIGSSARTNVEGIRQFTALVQPMGWQVESVPVKKALHLKSMLTALPDGTIIGCEEFLEDSKIFDKFIAMPEPEGVAVVHLQIQPTSSNQTPLLISSSAPKSIEKLQQMGYTLVKADVSEFEKLEGCVTCLSVRIRHG